MKFIRDLGEHKRKIFYFKLSFVESWFLLLLNLKQVNQQLHWLVLSYKDFIGSAFHLCIW